MEDTITQGQKIREAVESEFGFSDLDDAKQQELALQVTESIIKRVLTEAYVQLSSSKREEFDRIMEGEGNFDPGKAEEFLRANTENYDEIVTESISEMKKHLNTA